MPWSLNEGVIVSDPEGVSWTEAVKQQRSLRSNEARVAAMYAKLDSEEDQRVEESDPGHIPVSAAQSSSELVRIEIGKEHDALIASLSDRMELMSEKQAETTMAIVAALQAIGSRESVVNVAAPNVNVEPPNVNVEPPQVTVEAPEVNIQAAAPPNVTVLPAEIHLPSHRRTVDFTRDPLDGKITSAEITEE